MASVFNSLTLVVYYVNVMENQVRCWWNALYIITFPIFKIIPIRKCIILYF